MGRHARSTRVDLYPRIDQPVAESDFPANFTIQVWTGTAWETVVSKTNYPKPTYGQATSFPTRSTTRSRAPAC